MVRYEKRSFITSPLCRREKKDDEKDVRVVAASSLFEKIKHHKEDRYTDGIAQSDKEKRKVDKKEWVVVVGIQNSFWGATKDDFGIQWWCRHLFVGEKERRWAKRGQSVTARRRPWSTKRLFWHKKLNHWTWSHLSGRVAASTSQVLIEKFWQTRVSPTRREHFKTKGVSLFS